MLSAMGTEPQLRRIMAAFETANLPRCVSTVDRMNDDVPGRGSSLPGLEDPMRGLAKCPSRLKSWTPFLFIPHPL